MVKCCRRKMIFFECVRVLGLHIIINHKYMLFSITKAFGRGCSRGLANLATSGVARTTPPRVTGRGPFVEIPSFEIVGDSCAVLCIRVPESSLLCLRDTSILALNGNTADIDSNLIKISPSVRAQIVSPKLPTSIVMASANLRYHVIQLNEGETWYLNSADALVGWYGCSFRASGSKFKVMGSQSVLSEGAGAFIIKGSDNFVTIDLRAGEQISVNSASIVASNVLHYPNSFNLERLRMPILLGTPPGLLLLVSSASSILLNTFKFLQSSLYNFFGSFTHTYSESALIKTFSKFSTDVQHFWRKAFYTSHKNGIFCEFKGPAKIVLKCSSN